MLQDGIEQASTTMKTLHPSFSYRARSKINNSVRKVPTYDIAFSRLVNTLMPTVASDKITARQPAGTILINLAFIHLIKLKRTQQVLEPWTSCTACSNRTTAYAASHWSASS